VNTAYKFEIAKSTTPTNEPVYTATAIRTEGKGLLQNSMTQALARRKDQGNIKYLLVCGLAEEVVAVC